jgi:hypothetical protein
VPEGSDLDDVPGFRLPRQGEWSLKSLVRWRSGRGAAAAVSESPRSQASTEGDWPGDRRARFSTSVYFRKPAGGQESNCAAGRRRPRLAPAGARAGEAAVGNATSRRSSAWSRTARGRPFRVRQGLRPRAYRSGARGDGPREVRWRTTQFVSTARRPGGACGPPSRFAPRPPRTPDRRRAAAAEGAAHPSACVARLPQGTWRRSRVGITGSIGARQPTPIFARGRFPLLVGRTPGRPARRAGLLRSTLEGAGRGHPRVPARQPRRLRRVGCRRLPPRPHAGARPGAP